MSTSKKIISMIVMIALVMTMATVALVSTSAAAKVYFEDSLAWGNIHAYCYGGDGELLGSWPGTACTDEGNGIWSIEVNGAPQAIIFHANDDTNQTSNIEFAGDSMIAKLTEEWVQGDYKMVAVAEFSAYSEAPAATEDTAATDDAPVVTEPTEAPATDAPATDAPVVTPATGIEVDGVVYEVPVGTTVTYTVTVTADEAFEDIQAYVAYDSTALELVRIKSEDSEVEDWMVEGPARCPNLNNVLFNGGIDGVVKFNASDVAGFDFKDDKVLVTLEFVVKDAAYSVIELAIDEMTILGAEASYFTDGAASVTDGIVITETLTFEEEVIATPEEPTTVPTEAPTDAPTDAPTEPPTEIGFPTEPPTTIPAPATDAPGSTEAPTTSTGTADTPITGATTYVYIAMAIMAMAACAVVVLRKKVNG